MGRGDAEHKYWGPPEADKTDRTSYAVNPSEPGSEPAAEAAAAMAAGATVFHHSGRAREPIGHGFTRGDGECERRQGRGGEKGEGEGKIWPLSLGGTDPVYADHLLGSAGALFKFALDKQATYSISDPFYK